ncbi:MAG TPA: WD40 repeat domain-containing protein, partial [Gemmataceae bacterium]|nr:WD40 repeat domain-containing protein [Gemmataceae bacterium]
MSTVLVSCFRCGKAVLVPKETLGQTPYCSMCRSVLGLADPAEVVPEPDPRTQKSKEPPRARPAPSTKKSRPDDRDERDERDDRDERDRRDRRDEREDRYEREERYERDERDRRSERDEREDRYELEEPRREAPPEVRRRSRAGIIVAISLGVACLVALCILVVVLVSKKDDEGGSGGPGGSTEVALKRTIQVPGPGVLGVAFSPDGQTLATVTGYLGQPGELRFWRTSNGSALSPVASPGSDLFGVAFRPDGSLVAVASGNKGLRIFDRQARPWANFDHPSYVRAVAFSPDGRRVASSCERRLIVRDVTSGRELWSAPLHGTGLLAWRIATQLAFSPNGAQVACGDGGRGVTLYDAATGQGRKSYQGHNDTVTCTTFSPNGRYLATGSFDRTIKIWDLSGGAMKSLQGHNDWVLSVAFSRDNRVLASACRDGTVMLWDVSSGRQLKSLSAHTPREAYCVVFSPRERLLA